MPDRRITPPRITRVIRQRVAYPNVTGGTPYARAYKDRRVLRRGDALPVTYHAMEVKSQSDAARCKMPHDQPGRQGTAPTTPQDFLWVPFLTSFYRPLPNKCQI